jgi:SNF2 family DNA or RNA helicase
MPKWSLVSEELIDEFEGFDQSKRGSYLWLTPSDEFKRAWSIECFDPDYFYDFEEIVGRYSTVTISRLATFLDRAEELGYSVVFLEDPTPIIDWWKHLRKPPEFSLNSEFPEAINGLLPFQIEGLNYLKDTPYGGSVIWSTGTGKTALMAALIKEHAPALTLVVVKKNNKSDMRKKLLTLGDEESIIIEGTPERRVRLYQLVESRLASGKHTTVVLNYEKFRDDPDELQALIAGREVLILWDEMPSKLANRETQLYKAVRKCLYAAYSHKGIRPRPKVLRQYQFTATPIENNPNDQLSCIRLIDPFVWKSIGEWEADHVATRSPFNRKPSTFKNLDKMQLKTAHMTHVVDKADPEIARYFPAVIEDPQYIDWHPDDRKVYELAQNMVAERMQAAKEGEDDPVNAFQLMGILQMLCDNPEIVNASAENRLLFEEELLAASDDELEDITIRGSELALLLLERLGRPLTSKHCQKLERLRDLIAKHADEKILIFSTWGPLGMPLIETKLEEWGITYRSYRGTDNQREKAKNEWRANPNLQVLLLSDAGSDSIDLPEASVVIHYNLPLKWSRLNQRQNRAHRINSQHASVIFYILIMADSIEQRIVDIISKKLGYHFALYKEGAADLLMQKGLTNDDLWYILTGQVPSDVL